MKVQRYNYGASNVQQRKEGRAALRTPEQAGAEAYAPYGAVADVAGATADTLNMYQQKKNEEEKKQDVTQMATNTALTQTELKNALTQAEAENQTPEQYLGIVDAIFRGYEDSASMISDRNKDEASNTFKANTMLWRSEADMNAVLIKSKQTLQLQEAAYNKAAASRDFETMKFLNDMAYESKTIDQATFEKNSRQIASGEEAEGLFAEYEAAYAADKAAEFMGGLTDRDITPDAMTDFLAQKSEHDKLVKGEEQKQAEAEQLYQDIQTRGVINSMKYAEIPDQASLEEFMVTFSNENLEKMATRLDLTMGGRNALYNIRDARIKELASKGNKSLGITPDYGSKDYRDSLDTDAANALGLGMKLEGGDVFSEQEQKAVRDWQLRNAPETKSIGTATSNFINNGTKTISGDPGKEADRFIESLDLYNQLMGMDGVNLEGIEPDAMNMLEVARSFYGLSGEGAVTDPNAAKRVYIANRSASEMEREAAEGTYDPDVMLAAFTRTEAMSEKAGFSREDQWLWFDQTPVMPDAIKAHMLRIGKSMWLNEAITINGRPDPLKIAEMASNVTGKQAGVTTFNSGVPTGGTMAYTKDGGIERTDIIKSEVMMYPVTDKAGEPWAKDQMALDLIGKEIIINNQIYTIGPKVELELEPIGLDVGFTPMETGFRQDFLDVHEYEGNVIPFNHLQAYTPTLAQDQYDEYGHRNWMFMFRGKPAATAEGKPFGWTPYYDDNGNPVIGAPVREGMTDISGEPALPPRPPRDTTPKDTSTGELPGFN
jgi:hypothetical protein